jgi:hypothetical protein
METDIARCGQSSQSNRPNPTKREGRAMRVKKLRKLTLGESMKLLLLAGQLEEQVDGTLADLVRRIASGDDSAMAPTTDRLIEIGRPELAERLKKLLK